MCIRHAPQLQLAFNLVQEAGMFLSKRREKGVTQGNVTNEQPRQLCARKSSKESTLEGKGGRELGENGEGLEKNKLVATKPS